MSTTLAAAALAILHSLSPLTAPRLVFPGWAETETERGARYLSIAADVAAAVEEACEGRGEGCKRRSVTLVLGLAWHESNYFADADSPRGCYRGGGYAERCDGGLAATIYQMRGSPEERAAWLADRVLATREALRRASRSLNACRHLEPALRLSIYAGGRCSAEGDAAKRSRELWAAVTRADRAWPKP